MKVERNDPTTLLGRCYGSCYEVQGSGYEEPSLFREKNEHVSAILVEEVKKALPYKHVQSPGTLS
jgi:hypothetical protein